MMVAVLPKTMFVVSSEDWQILLVGTRPSGVVNLKTVIIRLAEGEIGGDILA